MNDLQASKRPLGWAAAPGLGSHRDALALLTYSHLSVSTALPTGTLPCCVHGALLCRMWEEEVPVLHCPSQLSILNLPCGHLSGAVVAVCRKCRWQLPGGQPGRSSSDSRQRRGQGGTHSFLWVWLTARWLLLQQAAQKLQGHTHPEVAYLGSGGPEEQNLGLALACLATKPFPSAVQSGTSASWQVPTVPPLCPRAASQGPNCAGRLLTPDSWSLLTASG